MDAVPARAVIPRARQRWIRHAFTRVRRKLAVRAKIAETKAACELLEKQGSKRIARLRRKIATDPETYRQAAWMGHCATNGIEPTLTEYLLWDGAGYDAPLQAYD